MATSNFEPMKYGMPLIAGKSRFQIQKEYEKEFGEAADILDLDFAEEVNFELAKEMAEDFTEGLTFHTVTVKYGYYEGFQFIVSENHEDKFDLEPLADYPIDNEDAHYYYDMCRSQVFRKAAAEKRKISRWLNSLAGYGYNRLVVTDHFSNGETWYSIA